MVKKEGIITAFFSLKVSNASEIVDIFVLPERMPCVEIKFFSYVKCIN